MLVNEVVFLNFNVSTTNRLGSNKILSVFDRKVIFLFTDLPEMRFSLQSGFIILVCTKIIKSIHPTFFVAMNCHCYLKND